MMTEKQVKELIPQRNIDLLYGYIKSIKTSTNIPIEINHICLDYANLNHDSFDKDYVISQRNVTEDSFTFSATNDQVLLNQIMGFFNSVRLMNIANQGTHTWKLQRISTVAMSNQGSAMKLLQRIFSPCSLGIMEQFTEESKPSRLARYEINDMGALSTSFATDAGKVYGFIIDVDDIISMRLDMTNLTLSIKNGNDQDFRKVFDVKNTDSYYRAFVTMKTPNNGWKIISYQHTF